ncbi:MAG TPA: agmatinase [Deltaproteobacteria bacterium]|nr:agmatinase [Deltaproteobacteria bacterium]
MGLIQKEEGSFNFGGVGRDSTVERPLFSVLPVPYDFTTSYMGGARRGPAAIIDASMNMELYDEELECEPWQAGIETLTPLEVTTVGPEKMVQRVEAACTELLEKGCLIPVLLGGEHSITTGTIRALKKKYPALSVLQLDAHADMRESYQESPYNHACVARRISEVCTLVQVGIRSLSTEEAEFLGSTDRVNTYFAKDIVKEGMPLEDILSGLTEDVFVTIDLDVFDPSIMPSTGTPEPGGLGWYDVTGLLRCVAENRNIVGFDVVELSPMAGNVAPDFLAAKLVYKLMGYIIKNRQEGDSGAVCS